MPRIEQKQPQPDPMKELLELHLELAKRQKAAEEAGPSSSEGSNKIKIDPLLSFDLWVDGLWSMGMDLD